jgi:glutamate-1-semialdehyde 2,1-aminomutase/spore coat polysaccharide biosynthesis protein SpsF
VSRATLIDRIVIAGDQGPEEDTLKQWLARCPSVQSVFFGSHEKKDLLSLFLNTARAYAAKHIVRVTSDCPLIDPAIIDMVIAQYRTIPGCDYCSNIWPVRTYPDGMDVEVFSLDTLAKAAQASVLPIDREHVTPWMQISTDVKKACVTNETDLSALRLTVDTPEDLAVIRRIYEHLDEPFGLKEILEVIGK